MQENRMTTTVGSLISQGQFAGHEVLCGKKGLNNSITHIVIIGQPEVWRWLRSGEFLLTTGYPYLQDPDSLSADIEVFIKKGVSGLAFKEGHLAPEMKEQDLKLCDEHGFPIIKMPGHINWIDVVSDFYGAHEEASQKSVKKHSVSKAVYLFQRILGCEYVGIDHASPVKADFPELMRSSHLMSVIKASNLWEDVRDQFLKTLPADTLIFKLKDYLITVNLGIQSSTLAEQLIQRVETALRDVEFQGILPAAVSWPVRLESTEKCFEKACTILQLGPGIKGCGPVVRCEEMDLALMLGRSDLVDDVRSFCSLRIGSLAEYDAMTGSEFSETLLAYFETDCSIQETAETMFVHPSTVKYRLARAYEILGSKPTDFWGKVNLYLALKLDSMLFGQAVSSGLTDLEDSSY